MIWVGTDNGVAKYENDGWQPVGVEEGFVGMHVYALAVSPDGEIWAGTRGAVVRIGRAGKGE